MAAFITVTLRRSAEDEHADRRGHLRMAAQQTALIR
jgi:hypothetical protein